MVYVISSTGTEYVKDILQVFILECIYIYCLLIKGFNPNWTKIYTIQIDTATFSHVSYREFA